MRKVILICALMSAGIDSNAQYKKASFLERSGRTYDVGISTRFLGDGHSLQPGLLLSYGRDKGKRLFHWFDFEVLFPTRYEYKSPNLDGSGFNVSVSGKSKLALLYRYNLAVFLTNIKDGESKWLPFITGGINVVVAGGSAREYNTDPEFAEPAKVPFFTAFSYGANLGAGVIYKLRRAMDLKLTTGFNYQGEADDTQYRDGQKGYQMLPSHPYLTLGIRFLMRED